MREPPRGKNAKRTKAAAQPVQPQAPRKWLDRLIFSLIGALTGATLTCSVGKVNVFAGSPASPPGSIPSPSAQSNNPPPLFGSLTGRGVEKGVDAPSDVLGKGAIANAANFDGSKTGVLLRGPSAPALHCPWEVTAVAFAGPTNGIDGTDLHMTVEGPMTAVSFLRPSDAFASADELRCSQALRHLCGDERSAAYLANLKLQQAAESKQPK